MSSLKILILTICLAMCAASLSRAAEVKLIGERNGIPVLRFSGPIELGDSAKVRSLLETLSSRKRESVGGSLAIIDLNSPGGILIEGLKIGELLHQYEVGTLVRTGSSCMSACAIAFLGGTFGGVTGGKGIQRELEQGAVLAFHGFYLDPASLRSKSELKDSKLAEFSVAKILSSLLISYATTMGVDPKWISEMLTKAEDEFIVVKSVDDVLRLRISLLNEKAPVRPLAQQAVSACNHLTGWRRPLLPTGTNNNGTVRVVTLTPRSARVEILKHLIKDFHESSGSSQSAKYSVERLIWLTLNSGKEAEINNLYDDLRRIGLPLISVDRGKTFLVDGWTVVGAGFYVMGCVVNISPARTGASASLEGLLLRTYGISEPFLQMPSDQFLFLFERYDQIL